MKDRLMIELDNDLRSRQNARELVRNAKSAGNAGHLSQQQIDAIVKTWSRKQRTTPKRWRKWPRKRPVLATGRTKC